MIEVARQCVADGMAVFPLLPGRKTPLGALAPHGFQDATLDLAQVEAWWSRVPEAGVGIATGASGVVVIDLDVKVDRETGEVIDGVANFERWCDEHNIVMPATYEVRTPRGGLHLYYTPPAGVTIPNSGSKIAPGVDIRGEGGYVVAAGVTLVPDDDYPGGKYVIDADDDLDVLPRAAAEAILAPKPEPVRRRVSSDAVVAEDVRARVRSLCQELAEAPEGQGNDTGARVAAYLGQYVGAGQIDRDSALEALWKAVEGWSWTSGADRETLGRTFEAQLSWGEARPRPWTARMTAPTADQAATEPVDELPKGHDKVLGDWSSDFGQARWLAQELQDALIMVTGIGFMAWDGRRWKEIDEFGAHGVIQAFYKAQHTAAVAEVERLQASASLVEESPELDKAIARAQLFQKVMYFSRSKAIIQSLKPIIAVDVMQLDVDDHLLNTPAGTIDLRTGEVRPHDPKDRITKITAGSWRPGFKHQAWEAAIEALDPEVRRYMQIRAGQALWGEIPSGDDCLVMLGRGGNGKSAFGSSGLMPAMGDYAALMDPNLLLRVEGGGASPERAMLRGVRLAVVEELPEGRSLSVAELKRVIGTETITGRRLYKDSITFRNQATIIIATNYAMKLDQSDDGTYRRICVIPFPYTFVGNPTRPSEKPVIAGLKHALAYDQDCHDAILTWAVEGAAMLAASPMSIMPDARPADIVSATTAMRASADQIYAFVTEHLVFEPGAQIAKEDLFAAFRHLQSIAGRGEWSMETFGQRFKGHTLTSGLEEKRPTSVDRLSRPNLPVLPTLPRRPRVFQGVRFRLPDED